MKDNQQGIVLMSTILFLLVITVLVLMVVENNILQIKMSNHYIERIKSFENAESLLVMGEQAIDPEISEGQLTVNELGNYQFAMTSSDCNNLYYLITANGLYLNAASQLQSFILLPKPINCNGEIQSNLQKSLVYWLN